MSAGTAILETFHRAAGQFVAADDMKRHAKISSAILATEIADLEKLGYVIESHPHFGYRLLGTPDRLSADEIKARLKATSFTGPNAFPDWSRLQIASRIPQIIGAEILVFEETASTNDVVEQLGKAGAREGLVVFAESQTKGRGRHGRTWTSPRGKGLWFSILLRPKLSRAVMSRITVAASVAVAQAIRQTCRLDARIKWPNDVLMNGRKLAGVLVEVGTREPRNDYLVLGIGIDVNCTAKDFPPEVAKTTTSLQMESGQAQDRVALAAVVLQALDMCYAAAQEDFDTLIDQWAQLSSTLGKQIVVRMGTRQIEGHVQALDSDGALLLRRDNGQIERIVGGDVVAERVQ
ncbi:MAG TPA: biotin--[acetyl-CoA-carboxylase] ligase [Verrucomicrobiae bacterium]|nr:biotin--[acetyl-CoA-carboxylase] ligase [Verrucomicrobiae bacterium]